MEQMRFADETFRAGDEDKRYIRCCAMYRDILSSKNLAGGRARRDNQRPLVDIV